MSGTGSGGDAGGPAAPAGEARRPEPKLLQLLVCPLTKTPLHYNEARQELVSRAARLAYPIRDGIPIMMAEEARALDDDEVRNVGKR